ncbi:MAG: flagellar motor protein MotB [Elusimicrobia bacterium]|nr:flagellar motor protein MotB [Elusimicrobiota bacterium]MDE2511549.1 flagellar motor protein MotB [Elusimicrobiota bacterium]
MSRKRHDLTGLWMVPYADLMSTMVILFLALFAYSYTQTPPEYQRAVAHLQKDMDAGSDYARVRADETDLAVEVKQEMDRLALRDFGLRVTSRRIHILLPEPVLFSPGSATLNPDAGRVLEPLAKLFAGIPNPILVAGHTDNKPLVRSRLRDNWELSAARAFAIGRFFVERGLAPERFEARGYGEQRPLATNLTPEGRARNRRVEISIVREVKKDS